MPRSDSTSYLGNSKLKDVGVNTEFTVAQLKELQRCAADPIYFIRKYVKIIHVDRGEIPFELWPFQVEMVKLFHHNRFTISKIGRQSGKSTTTLAYLLWVILFKENQNICILANKAATSRKLLNDLKKSYMCLPKWIQAGVQEWNKGSIELENGSKIMAASTSSDAIRGNAFNIIFLDEFAFVPPHIADEFFESVYPTISSGKETKIMIVSTPKGHNKFYKMWVEANYPRNAKNKDMQWNGYVPFAINWRHVPGRDEQWRKETVARVGIQSFTQEFECEFVGSSDTLISGDRLNSMTWHAPIAQKRMRFDETVLLDVHSKPQDHGRYVLVADTAGGTEGDFSAFTIMDISEVPYKLAAKYRSNRIRPALFADVIAEAAELYNYAFVLIETNDLGSEVANTLHNDLEYENVIMTVSKGKAGPQVGSGFGKNSEKGIRTNKATKRQGCFTLKTLIETDKLLIEDYDIIYELKRFVANNKGSYSAEPGEHDDLVMTLVSFAWLSGQRYFKDLTDTDYYLKLRAETAARNEDLFFGFFSDGMLSDEDDGLTL